MRMDIWWVLMEKEEKCVQRARGGRAWCESRAARGSAWLTGREPKEECLETWSERKLESCSSVPHTCHAAFSASRWHAFRNNAFSNHVNWGSVGKAKLLNSLFKVWSVRTPRATLCRHSLLWNILSGDAAMWLTAVSTYPHVCLCA